MKYAAWIIGAFLILPIPVIFWRAEISKATIAPRTTTEAYSTPRLLGNAERFYDLKAGYEAQALQARDLGAALKDAAPGDVDYLRTEYLGVKAACRDQALTYNADSAKETREALKSRTLPASLDPAACEK